MRPPSAGDVDRYLALWRAWAAELRATFEVADRVWMSSTSRSTAHHTSRDRRIGIDAAVDIERIERMFAKNGDRMRPAFRYSHELPTV